MASWWDRHGVPRLIKCACSQGQIMKARSKVVPHATGDVLELGCGGGINMEFYVADRVTSFTGLDPSPELLDMSRAAAQAHGIDADIQGGVGEAMPFESGRFDTVVTTYNNNSAGFNYTYKLLGSILSRLMPFERISSANCSPSM